jgi:hypothetical protein
MDDARLHPAEARFAALIINIRQHCRLSNIANRCAFAMTPVDRISTVGDGAT